MPNQTIQLEVLRDDKRRNISVRLLVIAPDDTPAQSQNKAPVSKAASFGSEHSQFNRKLNYARLRC